MCETSKGAWGGTPIPTELHRARVLWQGTRYTDKKASIVVRVVPNRYLIDIDSGTPKGGIHEEACCVLSSNPEQAGNHDGS